MSQNPSSSNFHLESYQKMSRQKTGGSRVLKIVGIIFLILIVIVVLGSVTLVAATGASNVPVLSKVVYREPQPSRVIEPQDGAEGRIQKTVKEAANNLSDSVEVEVSEAELTSVVRKNQEGVVEDSQVAIFPDHLEFWGRLPEKNNMVLTMDLVVEKINGVSLDVIKAKVGCVNVPISLLHYLTGGYEKQLENLLSSSDVFDVKNIILEDGKMKIEGKIKSQKDQGTGQNNNETKNQSTQAN